MAQQGILVGSLDEIESRFLCSHCRLVLRDPMQGDCGHRYCKNCVFKKFADARELGVTSLCDTCDPSEQIEISPDRTYPDNAIKREVTVMKVQCSNSPCTERTTVGALSDHLRVCEFKPQRCDQCGSLVPAVQMQEHRERHCLKRLVSCDICKQTVVFDSINDHTASTCPGTTVQCQFCRARIKDSDGAKTNHWANECPVGWLEGKPCPFGCTEMTEDGGWQTHREKCSAIHADRLLARHHRDEMMKVASSQSQSLSARGAAEDNSPPTPRGDDTASVDYEELRSLAQRTSALEKRQAESLALPAGTLTGESGDQSMARKYIFDLSKAIQQGDKLGELLEVIREQFDDCQEKIRQYEKRLQKDQETRVDTERKSQELIKLLAYKEMRILDLQRRTDILEHASYDGTLLWKITDVRKRKEEAREGKVCSFYSPPFFTGKAGYKMCARLYLNGDGAGKNTHISLFFVIMRGSFDALLPWPFTKKVSMILLDQNFEENVIDAFRPDTSSSSFRRPITDMNIASGCPKFMPLADFESPTRGYVKEDTMFIKFIVDKSDLPT